MNNKESLLHNSALSSVSEFNRPDDAGLLDYICLVNFVHY